MKPAPEYVLPDLHSLCVPIDAVELDPDNAKLHPEDQVEKLRLILREYKQHKPLVCQPKSDGRLVCRIGNGTLRAARKEGWRHIAIVRADSESDIKSMARALVDNTASWGSYFDEIELQSQISEIYAYDPKIAANLGWDTSGLQKMLSASVEDPAPATLFQGPDPATLSGKLSAAFDDPPQNLKSNPSDPGRSQDLTIAQVLKQSESNEWYTPKDIIDRARVVMGGIDVDPASCAEANRVVRASTFYDKEADGLSQLWEGRVWLNPPYGMTDNESNAGRWANALFDQYDDGIVEQAFLLVNGSFGYRWFKPLWRFPICFFYSKISFRPPEGTEAKHHPTHSNVTVYLGDNVTGFVEQFSDMGRIVLPSSEVFATGTEKLK